MGNIKIEKMVLGMVQTNTWFCLLYTSWHHVMYRKKELAVCSASSFKQKIKSAEGGT